jgi:hypothetical protein
MPLNLQGGSTRATFVHFVLVSVLLAGGTQAVPKPQAPFSIAISPLQQSIAAGTEVKVEIALKNISNREIYLSKSNGRSQAEFVFVVEAHNDAGEPAPETEYQRRVMRRETTKRNVLFWSEIILNLKPGEILQDEAIVSNLYDLSRPGRYLIQVSRRVSDNPKDGVVKSNIIAVTVTP